ncbi:MAG TPA: sulfatase [bacterium]|nr:sulfatase [bacterium]
MRRWLLIGLAVSLGAAALVFWGCQTKPSKPQYIFLFTLDACRRDHLSCYGYSLNTSPRIDQLAGRSFLFQDAVTQAPWTTASVATIVSSTFPCQHGLQMHQSERNPFGGLAVNFIKTLSSAGFQTASFMGGIAMKEKIPSIQLTGEALRWLKQNLKSNCLIWIYSYETHFPYVATEDCVERLDPGYRGPYALRFDDMEVLKKARLGRFAETGLTMANVKHLEALYDCQIMHGDLAVGMLVDSLRAWGCLDKSMIIIFADHGEEFLEHGTIEHGQNLYEPTMRVPLVIYCPALKAKPKRIDQQVGLIDIGPTVLDLVGVDKPASLEGRSLAPLMSPRFPVPADTLRPCGLPVRYLVAEGIAHRPEIKALRCPPWKLILDPFFGATELYDLAKDPGESNNLIDVNPGVASRLTQVLLVMEKYYPGGWCVAWRDRAGKGAVRGRVEIKGTMIEAVTHNFFPEADPGTDSLVTSADWTTARFAARGRGGWQGLEVRMAADASAAFNLRIEGAPRVRATVGASSEPVTLPAVLSPSQARVERSDLRRLFLSQTGDCFIFWLSPGAEPTAKEQKDKELKKQLKAIGYIE